ncbi:hypothetical protein ACE6H2_020024 [Prunus campanulata]
MTPSTPSLQGERGSEEKLSLLLLLLLLVPCCSCCLVAPACYGASIVAHAFAGVFLLWSCPLTLPLALPFFALPDPIC